MVLCQHEVFLPLRFAECLHGSKATIRGVISGTGKKVSACPSYGRHRRKSASIQGQKSVCDSYECRVPPYLIDLVDSLAGLFPEIIAVLTAREHEVQHFESYAVAVPKCREPPSI